MFIRSHLASSGRRGFTLMELLTVIAIMGIFTALTLSGLGVVTSGQLAAGGNQVVDLINQARQNAISENVPTALVMVTGSGNSKWDYRLFGIYELTASGSTMPGPRYPNGTLFPPGSLSTRTIITTCPHQPRRCRWLYP